MSSGCAPVEPRFVPGCSQQRLVLWRPRHSECREPALTRAEQLAAAAQPQILFGDDEAVLGYFAFTASRARAASDSGLR